MDMCGYTYNITRLRIITMDLSKLHLDWGASKYKGKVYRTYSLARSLWIDGKNKKETVINLGKLSDDQVIKWRRSQRQAPMTSRPR